MKTTKSTYIVNTLEIMTFLLLPQNSTIGAPRRKKKCVNYFKTRSFEHVFYTSTNKQVLMMTIFSSLLKSIRRLGTINRCNDSAGIQFNTVCTALFTALSDFGSPHDGWCKLVFLISPVIKFHKCSFSNLLLPKDKLCICPNLNRA